MGDFRKSGGKRFGGGRGGGFGRDRDRGPVIMHQAICAQCGKPCEVPFRPTEGKPVYCNTCFGGKKEAGYDRGRNNYKTPVKTDNNNDELKKQLEILNVKMDQLIEVIKNMAKGNNSRRKETKKPKKDKKK